MAELSDLCYMVYEKSIGNSYMRPGTSKRGLRIYYRLQKIGNCHVYRIEQGGELIGGVVLSKESDTTIEIKTLFVHPDFQGRGIGSWVINQLEQLHPRKRWTLVTPTVAERNINFYLKLGYEITGEFTPENLSFYVFEKDLSGC